MQNMGGSGKGMKSMSKGKVDSSSSKMKHSKTDSMSSKGSSMSSKENSMSGKGHSMSTKGGGKSGKGKGTSGKSSKPSTSKGTMSFKSPTISTDFSAASSGDDPLVIFSLAEAYTHVLVDLKLQNAGKYDNKAYLLEYQNVEPGSACPPFGGHLLSTQGRTRASVYLGGVNSAIALCVDGVVSAVSFYVFEDFQIGEVRSKL